MSKFIIAILSLAFLSACTTTVDVKTQEVERIKLDLPIREPLSLDDVEWKVHKIDNTVYYSLTQNDFNALALNFERIQNRLYLNRLDIQSYRDYYESD